HFEPVYSDSGHSRRRSARGPACSAGSTPGAHRTRPATEAYSADGRHMLSGGTLPQYDFLSNVLRSLIPDDADWESIHHVDRWTRIFQHEWQEGNIELLLRVPGQFLPQAIPCLARKLTFELDHKAGFIRYVIRSEDPLDHDCKDPFISN